MLIFDGDCGACTSAARWAQRHLDGRHEVVPYQQIDDLRALGLTLRDVETAAYWIDEHGPRRGHRAVAGALRAAGGGWGALGWLVDTPPLRPLSAVAYHLVARFRHRLPGATPACRGDEAALPDEPADEARSPG